MSSGWQQLMDGWWLGYYGMRGWDRTLDKLYLCTCTSLQTHQP